MILEPSAAYWQRIIDKTDIAGPDDCWEWIGSTSRDGYAHINWQRKNIRVHRLVWEWCNNRGIPEGMVIRHRCDNPICINPDKPLSHWACRLIQSEESDGV